MPLCLLIGSGRLAGGYVAPLLAKAGWQTTFVCRNREVMRAVNEAGGLWLRMVGESADEWVGDVSAVAKGSEQLWRLAADADLVATSVGPSSLPDAGRILAPLLMHRLRTSGKPVNIIAFENARQGPEIIAMAMIEAEPELAGEIGRSIGLGGAAAWRAVSKREVTPSGVRFDANRKSECYVGAASLVRGLPPLDGSVSGLTLVRSFDDRIREKLWLFNAGHAAAAYLGWHAGCKTLYEAMSHPTIRAVVRNVVVEAQRAFEFYTGTNPASEPIPPRSLEDTLALYEDPALQDPVVRVGREPRRKLRYDERFVGPAVAAMAAGLSPDALAEAAA
ncbi:MAG: hypothetical protein M3151_01560, partial [Actinomycetota bacterium]|nr:hypothetical protein [Actinomycetota bacterium]